MSKAVKKAYATTKNKRGKFFCGNRRALLSFWLFVALFGISLIAELVANDKPVAVKYNGEWFFPIVKSYNDQRFGGDFPTVADYRDPLIVSNIKKNGNMWFTLLPFSFNTVDYELNKPTPSAPDKQHWLGTDDEGRDVFARILYGLRLSIFFAILLTAVSATIGIVVGAVQGYFGGKIDMIIQRLLEVWESLPQLFILIIVASVFAPGFWTLFWIMLCFGWPSLVGVVRAEFLRTRNFEFVKAAKALGVSDFRVIFRHVLPNSLVASLTFIPFMLSEAIVSLTALDFLGLGLSHDYPSLGDLVRQGKDNLQAPWIGVSIFVVLASLLTMLIFIGEGVRDCFDSRRKS